MKIWESLLVCLGSSLRIGNPPQVRRSLLLRFCMPCLNQDDLTGIPQTVTVTNIPDQASFESGTGVDLGSV